MYSLYLSFSFLKLCCCSTHAWRQQTPASVRTLPVCSCPLHSGDVSAVYFISWASALLTLPSTTSPRRRPYHHTPPTPTRGCRTSTTGSDWLVCRKPSREEHKKILRRLCLCSVITLGRRCGQKEWILIYMVKLMNTFVFILE